MGKRSLGRGDLFGDLGGLFNPLAIWPVELSEPVSLYALAVKYTKEIFYLNPSIKVKMEGWLKDFFMG